jgi:glycosyltransferase involved in cell wall biosynthesis
MLVANDVVRDSRVQKVAWSAAEAGFEVLLLGYAGNGGSAPGEYRLGAARVVLTDLGFPFQDQIDALRVRAAAPDAGTPARLLARTRLAGYRGLRIAPRYEYKVRRRLMRTVALPGTARPGVKGSLRELLWKLYVRDDGDWRRTMPHLRLLEEAWAPYLERFRPDVIHAHDMHTPGIGVRLADRLERARGGQRGARPKVVYDAHEYVNGVTLTPERKLAYTGLEQRFIRRADAVVTVSGRLAEMLRDRYELPVLPTVVTNAPLLHADQPDEPDQPDEADQPGDGPARPDLRRRIGLAEGVPLLVYSGAVAPMRGITTLVEALPLLPDAHVALVCGEKGGHVAELVALAADRGVADRFHLAPYVAPSQVATYLSSATVGVIPILHTLNHEIALITKYYEYMHARLPILVSDVEAMAARTRELGNGEVFTAGDPRALADAARVLLADRATYQSRYTDELLEDNSWEAQARVLADRYVALAGRTTPPRPGSRPFGQITSARRPPPKLAPPVAASPGPAEASSAGDIL